MSTRSLFRLTAALFLFGLAHSQATVFKGVSGGIGGVWVYPQGLSAQRPPELQGIQLLPVDAAGRSTFTQFLPDQPRLKADLPGATRIVLPQEQGVLYRYRRSHAGGTDFGFFVVRPDGLAQPLVTFPGTGGAGTQDPIPNPVAVSGQGDAFLVATSPAAGGDLFEIELGTGNMHLLTGGLAPLDILPQGLILLEDWGAALSTRGPLRFERGGAPAQLVPLRLRALPGSLGANPAGPTPSVPTHFGNGLVASADGSTVALGAGSSPALMHVFTFHPFGPAVCVNDVAAAIADPGFGTQAAPTMALSPDGTRAVWKTIGASGECFSRQISTLPTPPEIQITGDLNFADTLNDTGVIAFVDRRSIMWIVGEANGAGGVEKGDFYRAVFPTGGGAPAFSNLSNTSGDVVSPFLFKGELETSDGLYQIPGQSGAVYFVDGSSGQGEVYRLNGATGTSSLVRSGVDTLDFIERAGSDFVLGILHDQPAQRELLRIPFDQAEPATSLAILPSTTLFPSRAGSPTGIFAGTFTVPGGQRIFQIDLSDAVTTILPDVVTFGSVLGFDGSGSVLGSFGNATVTIFFTWVPGGGALLGTGRGGFVLPGN